MISKIFHISDVHIRLFKRHEEYELVFNRLYEFIKENKDRNSVIFLGGDIVHNKIELSPELVLLTAKFFKSCADILPTILIQGNHDAVLNNPNRLDSLTPIVTALNHPNLMYWRETGVYEFNGVMFSVFGCADQPAKWTLADKIKGKYKIALHHGSVQGSFTDAEHEIETGITVEHFDGFDLGLLGDIHKMQFVNERKTVGYSSSVLQQNYGETLDGHGLIVWDLKTKSGKFVEIPNDFGYATFDLQNGECVVPDNLPANLRVRIKHENTTAPQIEEFVKRLGKQYKIIELTKQKTISQQNIERTHQILGNSRDVDYQNVNITDLLKSLDLGATEEELKDVCELNYQINKSLPINNSQRHVTWKPLVLEFENMFSYGEGNIIDFTHLKGIFGLFDTNIAGKSSIFDILCFVLYDKTTRTSKASHILNNTKDSFWVRFQFELHGQTYFIERIGTKKKDGNVKVDVNFWTYSQEPEPQKIMLNGEDRDKTNYQIRNFVGTYDDFVMTALSTQYDNQNFIEQTQKDRKELLYKFLDITVYDELLKVAKEQGKECQILLKEYEREELHSKSSLVYAQIGAQQDILTSTDKHLRDKKEWLKTQMTALLDLNKRLQTVYGDVDLASILKGIDLAKTELEKFDLNRRTSETNATNLLLELSKLEEDLRQLKPPTKSYPDKTNEHNELSKKTTQAKHDMEILVGRLEHAKVQQSKLGKHEYDPNCKYCIDNDFVKEATKTINSIPDLEIEHQKAHFLYCWLEASLLQSDVELAQIKEYDAKVHQINICNQKLESLKTQQETLIYKETALEYKLAQLHQQREEYLKNAETIEENTKVQQEIKTLTIDISKTEAEISKLETNQRNEYSKLESLKTQYQIINEKLDKYLDFLKKSRVYELYQVAVSRDGVPYRILETVLPVIESEVNSILNAMVNFTVKLESTEDKYIIAYIVYDDQKFWPVELSSGMERFVLSLAFRSSLTEITSLPKANFLTIDEGFGTLDNDNLMGIGNLFNYLKKQYDFLICVSHIEAMRDLVDSHIKIDKQNGYSRITI